MIKPDAPIPIEQRVGLVERLRMAHNSLAQPWLPSLYSAAADEIERLRAEGTTDGQHG